MAPVNQSRNKTAFTISIEAKKGITTGISTKDRARTIKVAIKRNANKKDIVSDVRYDLVKKYREHLADGSYQIKSDELADKIVQKVKENKSMLLL